MRPQQQNRRMRGRNNNNNNNNNNNRKGPNPLTRNYESNGPDVKIRGSAQQIAEKYATLARDAQSSGDRVMAENYLQHAEHYNRIIAAALAQMPIQHQQQARDDFDADLDDERDEETVGNAAESQPAQQHQQPLPVANGTGPQPEIEGTPAEVALNPEAAEGQQPREGRRERGRNRHEGRRGDRRHNDQPQVVAAPAEAAAVEAPEAAVAEAAPVAEAMPAAAAEGEAAPAPRRTRRPRRGETAAEPQAEAGAEAPATVEG